MPHSATEHQHFHFFKNKEITSLYFTIALFSFASGLVSIFVPLYFWQLGMSFGRILLFYLINALAFVIWAFLLLPLLRRLSDKIMIFLSLPFLMAYFIGLEYIAEFPILFYILPAVMALNMLFFNFGFHLDFSGAADKGHVGSEVGMRHTITSLVQFAAPFLGGLLIAYTGFQNTFTVAAIILFVAVFPLFFFKHRHVSSHFTAGAITGFLTDKTLRPFNISGIGYASSRTISVVIWSIFIFLSIGSIEKFGGIISIGLLMGAIVTYFAGFLSDIGKRRKILKISTWLYALIWVSRLFFINPLMIAGNHVAGGIASKGSLVPLSCQYYKIAQKTHLPGVFILSREVLYNLSRVFFIAILILLSYVLSQTAFFNVSFVLAALLTLLILFANRLHIHDLDDFIIEGDDTAFE